VRFTPDGPEVQVPAGTLITEAIQKAGLDVNIPCGGQGRCGRCAVIVQAGPVRRRSTVRLSPADVAEGYALACQTVISGDVTVFIPPQEKVERRLTSERTAAKLALPFPYDNREQAIRKYYVELQPPTLGDTTEDWARLLRGLNRPADSRPLQIELPLLRRLASTLRAANWQVTAVVEEEDWAHPQRLPRLLDVIPGDTEAELWGAAVDIGTTTVTVYLVDLLSGEVVESAADYNGQIRRGEDIISRIIYASKATNGLNDLHTLVVETINRLLERVTHRRGIAPTDIYKMTLCGNSTMIHLLLQLPPEAIRLEPYIVTINQPPPVTAGELGININPAATIDLLPGVASYMGSDITAGVVSSKTIETDCLTLFLDIGTNGEMVMGNQDWMVCCACSAGPAFEGAGVGHGMRATTGAIEEVWINSETLEPTIRVIGDVGGERGVKPKGICGSGLISLLAELFITGIMDKAGNFNTHLNHPRIREGEHGGEYVVAWASETDSGHDIVLTKVDIDNLVRAKAAIYAGYAVLAKSVGVSLRDVEQVLIGGSFGQYLNVEKAIQIGLLPDLPWERFKFLGNTAALGTYMALLAREARERVKEAASKMTYLELCADNTFTDEFMAAMFLPHTDLQQFPSVAEMLQSRE